jgi:MFS family permease
VPEISDNQDPVHLERVTFFWDRFRGISAGINESVFGTFLLLIAIRVFDASSMQKSILTGALWAGMFLMPVFLWIVSSLRMRSNKACMIYTFTTGLLFAASTLAQSANHFVLIMVVIMIIGVQGFTLLPRILSENYHPSVRGRRVGTTIMIHGITFLVVSQAFGILLDKNLDNYVWILAMSAFAYFAASFFYFRIPSKPLSKPPSRFPYHSFSLFWRDLNFAKIAVFWSLIEFGNLIMILLRIEYVANNRFGLNLSNTQITWLVGIVPITVSMITSRSWGRLFDRLRIETMQAAMGGFTILSMSLFFLSTNYYWMLFSMSLYGLAFGAQKILNQLWLTKIVHAEGISDYISAFSMINGVRGIVAPIVAYWLLTIMAPHLVADVAIATVAVGSVCLLILRRSASRN